MKTPILHLFLAGLFFPGAGWTLHAQLVADGATTTLANVTNTITGSVTVGTNGAFTLLVLSDNALLSNSAHGVIGRNATALSNEVQLISATARWRMGGDLYVGSNGAANRLVVSNGAVVENNNGSLAARAGSSNNVVLVTGVGSLWSNRLNLAVGWFAPGNRLLISNGGRVFSGVGSIGSQPGGSNNLVLVSGSGSHWTNQFNVGVGEPGNRLVIEEGGRVSGGTDGAVEGAEALVTGPGSLWSSGGDMAVGLNGSDSRLVVSNGAAVVAGGNGRVGDRKSTRLNSSHQ